MKIRERAQDMNAVKSKLLLMSDSWCRLAHWGRVGRCFPGGNSRADKGSWSKISQGKPVGGPCYTSDSKESLSRRRQNWGGKSQTVTQLGQCWPVQGVSLIKSPTLGRSSRPLLWSLPGWMLPWRRGILAWILLQIPKVLHLETQVAAHSWSPRPFLIQIWTAHLPWLQLWYTSYYTLLCYSFLLILWKFYL